MQSMAGTRQSRAAQGLRQAWGVDAGGYHRSTLLRARLSPFSKGGFCVCRSVDTERTASRFQSAFKSLSVRPYKQESPSLEGSIVCSVTWLPRSFVHSFTRSLIHSFTAPLFPGACCVPALCLVNWQSTGARALPQLWGLHPSWRHQAPKKCY